MLTTLERATYDDGRLIPQAGDEVYQTVRGPFGTPAAIHGIVYESRGQLRVRVTGTSSIIGGGTRRKTYRLSHYWTCRNDPEIERRERAADERRNAHLAEIRAEREAAEAWRANNVAQNGLLTPESLAIGDRLENDYGTLATVAEIDVSTGWVGLRYDCEPEGNAPGYAGNLASWKKIA